MRKEMARKVDPKDLLKKNRNVDTKQLADACEVLKSLRKHGIRGAGYNILTPFTRRHSSKAENSEEDPRTVHLRAQVF
jgi:hypothetical protein